MDAQERRRRAMIKHVRTSGRWKPDRARSKRSVNPCCRAFPDGAGCQRPVVSFWIQRASVRFLSERAPVAGRLRTLRVTPAKQAGIHLGRRQSSITQDRPRIQADDPMCCQDHGSGGEAATQ